MTSQYGTYELLAESARLQTPTRMDTPTSARAHAHAHVRARASTHTHTHTDLYIYCFSTATMIRKRAPILRYKYIVCFVLLNVD